MAEVVWTEPALEQLDNVAAYIALDFPEAAADLVGRVLDVVGRLVELPDSGREPPELSSSIYREVVCPPCRIFYREDGDTILIIHVMRAERQLRQYMLNEPDVLYAVERK